MKEPKQPGRRSEYNRRWREKHPGVMAMYSRRTRHGIEERVIGPCFICGDEGPLDVDHDHKCCPGPKSCERCRRGLLCHPCNSGLGSFRDDPSLLRLAAEYLDDPPGLNLPDEDRRYQQRVRRHLRGDRL